MLVITLINNMTLDILIANEQHKGSEDFRKFHRQLFHSSLSHICQVCAEARHEHRGRA